MIYDVLHILLSIRCLAEINISFFEKKQVGYYQIKSSSKKGEEIKNLKLRRKNQLLFHF